MRDLIDRLRELVGGEEIPAINPVETKLSVPLSPDEWEAKYLAGFWDDDFRTKEVKYESK